MYKRISTIEAKQMIENDDATVVDIRDPLSYEAGHIPGATLLNNDNLGDFLENTDLEKPLLVCCYHGNSSQGAAQFLEEKGFKLSCSIDGGFEQWKMEFEVES